MPLVGEVLDVLDRLWLGLNLCTFALVAVSVKLRRHLQFLPRHKASETLFLSAACDGRVCAWSDSGTALWGIRGLRSGLGKRAEDSDLDRLPLDNVSLAADSERLFFSGLVVNPVTPGQRVIDFGKTIGLKNHGLFAAAVLGHGPWSCRCHLRLLSCLMTGFKARYFFC